MILRKFTSFILKGVAVFFFGLAILLVSREIHLIGWHKIVDQLFSTPLSYLLITFSFMLCDYLAFSAYDFLALAYLGIKLKIRLVIRTAMISFAITNTTGHAYLAGGSIRYLLYSNTGINATQIVKMIAFESLTFLLGMGVVLDCVLIGSHFLEIPGLSKYQRELDWIALLLTVLFIFYFIFFISKKKSFSFKKEQIKAPTLAVSLGQMLIGSLDIFSASLVFYTLFSAHLENNYFVVSVIFLLAQLIGISSQVPGGLGVFEATFLYLYQPTTEEKTPLLATLIVFRVLYYFLPLVLGGMILLILNLKKLLLHKKDTKNNYTDF